MRNARVALIIEFAVILTALPRWIPALMLAEGFALPEAWLVWWIPISAVFNGGMAVAEAVAIAYVFSAWHRTRRREDRRVLLALTILMILTFSFVLTPYIVSSVLQIEIREILTNIGQYGSVILLWGTAVVATTGVTVMAVGVATGSNADVPDTAKFTCWCGKKLENEDELAEHNFMHEEEVVQYSSSEDALNGIMEKYRHQREAVMPAVPKLVDIARWRKNQEVS